METPVDLRAALRELLAMIDLFEGTGASPDEEELAPFRAIATYVGTECGHIGDRWVCIKSRGHDRGHVYELRPEPLDIPSGLG